MGITIDKEDFSEVERAAFSERLSENLAALRLVLARPGFGEGPHTIGAELELNLLDSSNRPLLKNQAVLDALSQPHTVQLEIDRFNLEINAPPLSLRGRPFSALSQSLETELSSIATAALAHGGKIATIGILPTLVQGDLGSRALSDACRYRALDKRLTTLSKGSFPIRIEGTEPLSLDVSDIAAEGANTSFQVHLRVSPAAFADHYNAAQLATAAVLAVAGNSPTFLGHTLWAETRVALFRQSVDDRPEPAEGDWRPARVSFGHGWVRRGALELFEECVAMHSPLLPVCSGEPALEVARAGGLPELAELRLHNGTVWRWNRAIYDPADGGHVRIEMRFLPAGPTVTDMAANAAFLLGLTLAFAPRMDELLARVTFGHVRQNFYEAARHGLDARLLWPTTAGVSPSLRTVPALLSELLALAEQGLLAAGVDETETKLHLAVIERRVAVRKTGSAWQLQTLARLERRERRHAALVQMLGRYVEQARSGEPVHAWPID